MSHRSDLISGWWYMRPGETPEQHNARITADPRYPDLGLPFCDLCDGAVRERYECASCRDDGLTRHADCCTD